MPNSVLWVCLVAVWLFVLVPMIVKRRPEMRRTTEATAATRVLHRGGKSLRAKVGRSAGRHPQDLEWEPPVREFRKSGVPLSANAQSAAKNSSVSVGDADAPTEVMDKVDADPAVDLDVAQATAAADAEVSSRIATAEADDESLTDAGDQVAQDLDGESVSGEDASADDDAQGCVPSAEAVADDSSDDVDDLGTDVEDFDVDSDVEGFDLDADVEDFDSVAIDQEAVDELADAVPEPAMDRRRGGFNPAADQRRSLRRYRTRQRVMIALVALTIAAAAAGIVVGTPGWIVTGGLGVVFVGYLVVLRRAVRVEQRIRAQRMMRLERDRRRRRYIERERAFVPQRLRRPGGVVLEIDDEDPAFDHLPHYQRRAVGRDSDREMQRAVG